MIDVPVSIIGFNEIDALKQCMPNLLKFGARKISFFDGPFTEYESEKDYSTDGTLEYLRTIPEVEIIRCGRMNHIEKQNQRFIHHMEDKFILIVDCDEMVHGDHDAFCYSLEKISEKYIYPCFNVPFTDLDMYYSDRTMAARVFKNPGRWKVVGKHWFFYYDNYRVEVQKTQCVGGIQLLHDSTVRPSFREDKMKEFQKIYTPREDKFWLHANNLDLPQNGIQCHECGCTFGYAYYYDINKTPPKQMARSIDIRCREHGVAKGIKCGECKSDRLGYYCKSCNSMNSISY